MIFACCTDARRTDVLGNSLLNGIDFLEVLDNEVLAFNTGGQPAVPRQQTLLVHFLNPLTTAITTNNILITGGESTTNITALWAVNATATLLDGNTLEQAYCDALPDKDNVLVIRTSVAGDFSTYSLRLVFDANQATDLPISLVAVLPSFDPQLAEVCFSFKAACGPAFDCKPRPDNCAPVALTPPPINYLAKDYGSFRTLMLDRINQLVPTWGATSEADLGIMLAELIAFAGDHLSYRQDAIATEAYLQTARSRISLRRHATLVDYQVHDGCNARTFMQLQILGNPGNKLTLDHKTSRFYTYAPNMPASLNPADGNEEAAVLAGVHVFEPMLDTDLYPEHNQFSFYTWGDSNCCLPAGATEATLYGNWKNLQPGDFLVFQEILGPHTGNPADADLRHRCVVRLSQVATEGSEGNMLVDPLYEDGTGLPITSPGPKPTPITEIQWGADDALTVPVCISSTYLDDSGNTQKVTGVSVAFGNAVLVDHGLSFVAKPLEPVPEPSIYQPPNVNSDHCIATSPVPLPVRYRPVLQDSPVTQAVPLPMVAGALDSSESSTTLIATDASQALPQINLAGTADGDTETWSPLQNLLESGELDRNFVVEIEYDASAHLRFGDNVNGSAPEPDTQFAATYRIGNGTAGNVGADTLIYFYCADPRVTQARNPLPGMGGVDPEATDQIRRRASQAFLTQERAITMNDYEQITDRFPQIERSYADLRWTGSWYTVFVAAEPDGGSLLAPATQKSLKKFVNRYRLAGQDLELNSPDYVSLQIALDICIAPNYFRSDVLSNLANVLSDRQLPDGATGVFYPDNFGFGQTVYLSPIYAAARTVAGVESISATVFQPQGSASGAAYLVAGEIRLGPMQVARLENDPSFPSHGTLTLSLEGGK